MKDRKFNPLDREEKTRNSNEDYVVEFTLDEIKSHFDYSIKVIKEQVDIIDNSKSEVDCIYMKNMLRSSVVFLISAFDFFLHEVIKYGICKMYEEYWNKTKSYENIKLSMKTIEKVLVSKYDVEWFRYSINDLYSGRTLYLLNILIKIL